MTRKAQKDDERQILKALLKQLNMIEAKIDDGNDPPDFLLCYKEIKVAVEITEYHADSQASGGSGQRAFDAFWQKLLDYLHLK